MKDHSNSCQGAAVRVQYWFKKDKANPAYESDPAQFYKRCKCNFVRAPRTVKQVEHLPLQGYLLTKKKRQLKRRCVVGKNSSRSLSLAIDMCSARLENATSEQALSSKRIISCKSKEHQFAHKRLKITPSQHAIALTTHQVVPIKASTEQELPRYPYRIESERHFLLCAIPMYPVFKDELKRN
jgi:hypothetical protein